MFNFLNATLNDTKKNVSWPKYEVNFNEYNLTFSYDNFIKDRSRDSSCELNLGFMYALPTGNYSNKNVEDIFLLG